MKRLLSTLAVTSCLLTLYPATPWANAEGLVLFSGVKSENQLPYYLDFGGQTNIIDRYRLRIPAQKMKLAVAQFTISYPESYKGSFDPKKVEIKVGDKKVPVSEVRWNKEARVIEIFPQDPVPAGKKVELVLSNVENPSFPGMHYFSCQVLSPGDVPLLRSIGTWIIGIN
jgi:hypothetical protein